MNEFSISVSRTDPSPVDAPAYQTTDGTPGAYQTSDNAPTLGYQTTDANVSARSLRTGSRASLQTTPELTVSPPELAPLAD